MPTTHTPSGTMGSLFQDRDRGNTWNDRTARYAMRMVFKGVPYRYNGTSLATVTSA